MPRLSHTNAMWFFVMLHLIALVFGLIGMLIMLPNPDLWASDRTR
ncbi:MAG: hypothetical protein R2845_09070 [Thermomicrobiales bacterium]